MLGSLQSASKGTQACEEASSVISGMVSDLETSAMFASYGALKSETQGTGAFAQHHREMVSSANVSVFVCFCVFILVVSLSVCISLDFHQLSTTRMLPPVCVCVTMALFFSSYCSHSLSCLYFNRHMLSFTHDVCCCFQYYVCCCLPFLVCTFIYVVVYNFMYVIVYTFMYVVVYHSLFVPSYMLLFITSCMLLFTPSCMLLFTFPCMLQELMVDIDSLVSGTSGTQDQLAIAARKTMVDMNRATEATKLASTSLNDNSDFQVIL